MNMRVMWGVVIVLMAVIIVMTWLLFATPAHAPTVPSTDTTQTSTQTTTTTPPPPPPAANAPLHDRVIVNSPKASATVTAPFTVSGEAPNNWYFEAVFPIQVRDGSDNVVGHGQGQAQTDWTIPGQVPFTAQITLDTPYHGPATLIILKDNESGLPENDDSIEFPITIK